MRIAQISDFHYTSLTWNPFRLFPKRFVASLHWLFHRKARFSKTPIETLPEMLQSLQVDLLLLGGDFTSTAMPKEFEEAKNLITKIEKPWIAIPGNHDLYTAGSEKTGRFFQYFSNLPEHAESFTLQKERVEAQRIAPSFWVVSLNTCYSTHIASSHGLFSEETEKQLEKILSTIPDGDKVLLFNHYPFFPQGKKVHSLERGDALEALLMRHKKIALYLHGHTHRHSIADLQSSKLPIILDSGTSAKKEGGSWNCIDLDEQGCLVTPYFFCGSWQKQESQRFAWRR